MEILRFTLHYGIHLIFPVLAAILFFPQQWKKASIIGVSCILIDIDHLVASPIFDPNRCSIFFHPLHSAWAMGVYMILFLFKKTRMLATGLVIHLLADLEDCLWI
jgi:hypothetical protein